MSTQGYCEVAKNRSATPVRLYYEVHGHGIEHVIFIMGLGGLGEYWAPQAKFLAEHGYQTCFFDNRGVGRSDSPPSYYTTKEMALDTVDLLNHLGWKSNVHVIGVSMGGMIALELASNHPEYIGSLTLTSTHAGDLIPTFAGVTTIPRMMFTSDPYRRIELSCSLLFPQAWLDKPSRQDPEKTNRQCLGEEMKSRVLRAPIQPMAGAVGQLSAVLRHRLGRERLEQLRQTKIPILVCTGDQDNLVRPSNSYFLAEALDARLEVFEGCGHVLSMQEPERYNKLILEHIRSAKRAANRSSL